MNDEQMRKYREAAEQTAREQRKIQAGIDRKDKKRKDEEEGEEGGEGVQTGAREQLRFRSA